MGERRPKSKGYWEEELKYVKRRVADKDFSSFNNDPAVFRKYVETQYCHCMDDAFIDLAGELLGAISSLFTYKYRIDFEDGRAVNVENPKHPLRVSPPDVVKDAGYDWDRDGVAGVADLRGQ